MYVKARHALIATVGVVMSLNLVAVPVLAAVDKSEGGEGWLEIAVLLFNLPGVPVWCLLAPYVLRPAWLDVRYLWDGFQAHMLLAVCASFSWGLIIVAATRFIPLRAFRHPIHDA